MQLLVLSQLVFMLVRLGSLLNRVLLLLVTLLNRVVLLLNMLLIILRLVCCPMLLSVFLMVYPVMKVPESLSVIILAVQYLNFSVFFQKINFLVNLAVEEVISKIKNIFSFKSGPQTAKSIRVGADAP